MRREHFYAGTNRSGNVLHVETDGAIVNIRVGLIDAEGRQVTHVSVTADGDRFAGEAAWYARDDNGGRGSDHTSVRIVKEAERDGDIAS